MTTSQDQNQIAETPIETYMCSGCARTVPIGTGYTSPTNKQADGEPVRYCDACVDVGMDDEDEEEE